MTPDELALENAIAEAAMRLAIADNPTSRRTWFARLQILHRARSKATIAALEKKLGLRNA